MKTINKSNNKDKQQPEGDLGFKTMNTLLGDTYLPALRCFQTTQRTEKKPQHI